MLAVGSALPKMIVTQYFFVPDQLVYEQQADDFAWSNAENDFELKVLKDLFQALAANSSGPFSDISNVTTALEYYDTMSELEKESLRIKDFLDQHHAAVDKDHPTPLARSKSIQTYIDAMHKN